MDYEDIDGQKWYKVKWTGYDKTTQEPEENLRNIKKKVEEYYKRAGQAGKGRMD